MKLKSARPSVLAFSQLTLFEVEEAFEMLTTAEKPSQELLEGFCRPFRFSRARWESKNDRNPGRFLDAALWMIELGEAAIKVGETIETDSPELLADVVESVRGHCAALEEEICELEKR